MILHVTFLKQVELGAHKWIDFSSNADFINNLSNTGGFFPGPRDQGGEFFNRGMPAGRAFSRGRGGFDRGRGDGFRGGKIWQGGDRHWDFDGGDMMGRFPVTDGPPNFNPIFADSGGFSRPGKLCFMLHQRKFRLGKVEKLCIGGTETEEESNWDQSLLGIVRSVLSGH